MPETPTSRPRRKAQAIRQRAPRATPESVSALPEQPRGEPVAVLPEEDLGTNYALSLTDSVEDAVAVVTAAPTPEDSFARRLSEALAAISQAQTPPVEDQPEPADHEQFQPEPIVPEQVDAQASQPAPFHPTRVVGEPVQAEPFPPGQLRPEPLQPDPVVREPVAVDAPATYTPAARLSAYTAARQPEPEGQNEEDLAEPVAIQSADARAPRKLDASDSRDAEREGKAVRRADPESARKLDASAAAEGEREGEAGRGSKGEAARNVDAGTGAGTWWRKWLAALDKIPPIRLPLGPAVPWRYGLPALVLLVAVVAVMSHASGGRPQDSRSALPAQEIYPVQADGPLFATPTATAGLTDDRGPSPVVPTKQSGPIGVQEPAGAGFDLLDIAIKLAAVLGLAYGSLALLKKAGVGGAGRLSPGATKGAEGMRVVGTVTLAPNRSVHALRVADGRTLLIGATPNSVNLLTELGELDDDAVPTPGVLDGIRARLH